MKNYISIFKFCIYLNLYNFEIYLYLKNNKINNDINYLFYKYFVFINFHLKFKEILLSHFKSICNFN
jgi:hypothetical protein